MIGVSVVIIVEGTVNVGGPANVLNVTYERGRLDFFEYDHIRRFCRGFHSIDNVAVMDVTWEFLVFSRQPVRRSLITAHNASRQSADRMYIITL